MRATTVGIVSIGDMGLGMAKLLQAHDYRVVTVGEGRSEHTLSRIRTADIEVLPSDQALVAQADYILSIVPPRNALATAHRIAGACKQPDTLRQRDSIEDVNGQPSRSPLYYLELNATPPRLAAEMAALFEDESASSTSSLAWCQFLDGGIIGGPPAPAPAATAAAATPDADEIRGAWKKPSVVLSGPMVDLPPTFAALATVLNAKVVSPRIGAASTLKLSFAALTKGLTALSILSFSTAQRESLLPELLAHLDEYSPQTAVLARRGVVGMSPKAYRWVDEMRGIGEAFDTQGGWDGVGAGIYDGFAEIYRTVAEDTILGLERVGARERGTTVGDAALLLASRRSQEEKPRPA
ncbi:Dehydrogenase multihelical [Penicillium canariense]|uniref:Dehydrogenase multihelical n=1 Tax=Penicillium canariense TaxID=189055 RepID=A0A9W9IEP9_9EURO|nr:Dehydrogenase multihelical [Penicillium canariense]KAJ5174972.1 Dehydrogenase multihelical [Penicillium canariense]